MILDLDGTLVDSVYVHVATWCDALSAAGLDVPAWKVHRGIGLSSERLLAHVLGRVPEEELAGRLKDDHTRRFLERAGDLRPTPGAGALLEDLRSRDVPFVVATSAGSKERAALLDALGNPEVDVTDADEVEASKPDPEPLLAAAQQLRRVDTLTMVGDAPWDGHAAKAAGMGFCAVRTGGFADAELRHAGAALIADDAEGLLGVL